MKKTLILIFTLILTLSLFVSCNDGDEGLFQMAAKSVKKESFKILNILNKESDDVFIVSTDNGIAKYNITDRKFSSFIGTGVQAACAIWANGDGSKFVYYDADKDSYFNQDGVDVTSTLNVKDYSPQPFYTVDGKNFTYVYKDSAGNFYSQYSSSALSSPDLINPSLIVIDTPRAAEKVISVTIIGNGTLRVMTKEDNQNRSYLYNAGNGATNIVDKVVQGFADTGLFITIDGDIYDYKEFASEEKKNTQKTDTAINKRPAMFSIEGEKEYTYFIPEGTSSVFELKREDSKVTKSTKSITGLQNITVIAILEKEDNKLIVLTANNGVQELEMK